MAAKVKGACTIKKTLGEIHYYYYFFGRYEIHYFILSKSEAKFGFPLMQYSLVFPFYYVLIPIKLINRI